VVKTEQIEMSTQAGESTIRDVWQHNLVQEFEAIRQILDKYPYVAMDTEFPGVVARPVGDFSNSTDYQYQTLRCNVDLLKLIQLGITFTDSNGGLKPGVCTWQFNLKFDLEQDMFAQDSIDLLQRSGIEFDKHRDFGIDVEDFAELLISSGLVLNPKIRWLAFHGGYDFAYLIRCMTGENLPADENEFFSMMAVWFPMIYDIKVLMQARNNNFGGGLNEFADLLQVVRIGPQHQAGSDSLLTALTFFELVKKHLPGLLEEGENECVGRVYGLNYNASSKRDKQ